MIGPIDQLIIGDKASYDDFSASMASRKIKQPKKKIIKETVPFSNKTYDFSAINGEIYWEERELEYVFELMADTPEELEELKSQFSSWVMNVQEAEIYDPFIPDYHFIGTYSDMSYEDEEDVEKTTVTVIFTAYPYMIANVAKVYEVTIAASSQTTLTILNESMHPITPLITSDKGLTIKIGDSSYVVGAGTVADEVLKLPIGLTTITLKNTKTTACTVEIRFFEEVG